ncbi:MAG: YihY/virulence factor BrkB family protein [Lachnospiraceae bacterium]|nr:YihY/virulence factor BrkB family protein [Lachnospiraceae bacterium]
MKKLLKILDSFGRQLKEDNITAYASSCAFFIFLSLIPMIMLLLAILPYTPIDPTLLTKWVLEEFPAGTGSFIVSVLEEVSNRSIGLISVSAVMTLWSAGKGINSLIMGFNAIDRTFDKRNGIWVRIIACVYTLIFLAGVLLMLIFVVMGRAIMEATTEVFPRLSNFFEMFLHFRSLISIGVLSVLFMLCYALLPFKKHKFREQIPGAVLAATVWTGYSYLFSLYINKFGAFSMYGSLTAIIILMIWLYMCMYFLFLGDNLNKYFRPIIKGFFEKQPISELKGQLESLEE